MRVVTGRQHPITGADIRVTVGCCCYVALLDTGEATLKRYYKEGHRIRLQPANSSMEPRIVEADRCRIQGVVIGVLRRY